MKNLIKTGVFMHVCVCMHACRYLYLCVFVCVCVCVCMCVCGTCIVLMRALDFRKEKSLITYHHPCVYYVSGYRRGDSKMYLVPTHVLGGGGNTTWQILNWHDT